MSDPKYKVGDIVRCAGMNCTVAARHIRIPSEIECRISKSCYTYDLKRFSDGASFGFNVLEDEISPTEEEGEYEMTKRYKFAANSLVRLKKNNAIGRITVRWRDDHDLGVPANMYSVQFNSLSGESDIIDRISGEFKESDLEKPSFKNDMSPDRGRDITGVICYIPKRSDTEFVNVDFGPKYICIDADMPEVARNLTLVSCDDYSFVEACSEEICLIDEPRINRDVVYKLKVSWMKCKKEEVKKEEDDECPKLVIDEENRIDPYKFLIHEIVRYTGTNQICPVEEKYEVIDRMRLNNCNYYELKGYNTNKRVKDPISGVDILVVEANLDSAVKSIKSGDGFKFNIEDHVHYNGDEFPKANYIIAERKTLFGRKFYRVKAEDMIHSYYTTWLRESDFTPATTSADDVANDNKYKFKRGDYVYYESPINEKYTGKYLIINPGEIMNGYPYYLCSRVDNPEQEPTWMIERYMTPAEDKEAEEPEKKSEPMFKSGDTVCYCGDGDEELHPKSDRYEISTWIKAKDKYYYALKAPNGSIVTSDKKSRYFREEDLTYVEDEPIVDKKPEVEPKFYLDDIVRYVGKEEIFPDSTYYVIASSTLVSFNHFAYFLETYPDRKIVKNRDGDATLLIEEKDLIYSGHIGDANEIKDIKDEDFHYDIDDHVWFMGHEHIVVRKMNVGLNKYYKIRLTTDTDDKHDYMVSEYALDKEPANQPPKNEFHPTSEMSLYDHLMNAINKGGYKVPRIKDIDTTEEEDEGSLYREPFILSCTNVYPCDIKVYDLGLGDKMPDDYTMKVMVSQPLSDKKEKQIVKDRNKALLGFTHTTNCEDDSRIVVVDNLQFDRKPTPEEGELNHFDYLSIDIKLMKDIDYIIFASGWQNSKGCNIEYQMAKTYGIPMWFA